LVEYRGRLGAGLRQALAWGLIFTGVAAGYGLWKDLRPREAAEVMVGERLLLRPAPDGHFYATLAIGGVEIQTLIDTGASAFVLTGADAQALGFETERLDYSGQAQTANGLVKSAPVRLGEVALGPYFDREVEAEVTAGDLDISLLGMSYLSRFHMQMDGEGLWLWRGASP
jgi:aspartyl protease family protein